ncbi:SET domain [Macleaya cordata]|uniref:SET domain n=1 Tax=Macleaya cordata TaxID=56857 RepID=A0A200QNA5_MACCD|nr:SET domain [Macleaya cordata]
MSESRNNQLLKITEIEGRGRALVASQPLKAGQVLLRDSPLLLYTAVALKNGDPSNFCTNCFRKLLLHDDAARSKVLKCPNCSYHALFCSPNCQSIALSTSHTPWVCQALNCIRYSRSLLDPDAQIQAIFLISAYNLAVVSPSSFQLLLSLQGESPAIPNPQTLALHSFISSLSPPQSFAGFGFSPELTAALLAKDKQNAFGLMDPIQENNNNSERSVRAYGIYPKASFFNHDCLPNACRFDYVDTAEDNNTDIIIRAIHDIQEGREICLSYFPVNWSYKDRQRRLMDDYGFTCDCDRCKVEANWKDDNDDNMESDDDDDEQMMAGGSDDQEEEEDVEGGGGDNEDFPHAYFFVKYVCERENCGGTLAPLPPSPEGTPSNVLECNVCGLLRTEEDEEEEDGVMSD